MTAVAGADDPDAMDAWGRYLPDPAHLHRLELRYFLSDTMASTPERTWTPTELADRVEAAGFRLGGRPGKVVSDHLRAEVNRGRVVRVGRGRYRAGTIPGSTRRRMRNAIAHRRRTLAEHQARRDQSSQTWSW